MTQVFNTYSRLEGTKEDVLSFVRDEIDLPEAIDEVTIQNTNGKVKLKASPKEEAEKKYTPTALLKCKPEEKTVVVEDDGSLSHQSVTKYEKEGSWGDIPGEDEEHKTRDVTYYNFYGHDDDVLVNSHLRKEMFDVLCDIAEVCISGFVEGIVLKNGELHPVVVEAGGNRKEAEIDIARPNEEPSDENSTVQWEKTV